MQSLLSKHWHHLPTEEVTTLLESDKDRGLDHFELDERRERFGPNELSRKKAKSLFLLFLAQFNHPLIYILLLAAIITAVLKEPIDASVIFAVVVLNALIGFVQESKARKAIESLSQSMVSPCTVVRAGEKLRVSSVELVPGDLVLLQSGDKVPADLRLLRARELQIDESALTGESVPSSKTNEPLAPDTVLADRSNMAYASTLVTFGAGAGVVVATGDYSEIGRINTLLSSAEALETPLTRKISRFGRVLLLAIIALAGLTFAAGALQGEPLARSFLAAVALAVAIIPEGLPAAVTITLAIGVSRMARRHAIIRKLPAVETLGSTSVICSDKTGTLTQNQMTVQVVFTGGSEYAITGTGYRPEGRVEHEGEPVEIRKESAVRELLLAGLLCNEAVLKQKDGEWVIEGDPTEGALITAARKAGLGEEVERAFPRVDSVPFESQRQYMITLHRWGEFAVAYMKGSVERVLLACDRALGADGETHELDRTAIEERTTALAGHGLRVLAFARFEGATHELGSSDALPQEGWTFLGLSAMIDPPRPEAAAAVKACQSAGILVKMITGDHAITAEAIAERLGLEGKRESDGRLSVLTGAQLARLSDDELVVSAMSTAVFARVAPEQKLRLVEALQVREHVVAMTGDGVNDAPALRRADIGVAMGIMGTEVAKEAADMILTDDNFSTIEAAVEEGRAVFDNLIRFITWTLSTNLGQGLVILIAVMLDLSLPILPVQVLWVNMTTAIFLGLTLAFEAKEQGIMERTPRPRQSPILTPVLLGRMFIVGTLLVLGVFLLYEYEILKGSSMASARTAAVNTLVFGQLFYLFNSRSLTRSMLSLGLFSNRWLWPGVGAMIAAQLALTYLPFMNRAFHTEPIGLSEWAMIMGVGLVISAVVATEKALRRAGSKKKAPPGRGEPRGARQPRFARALARVSAR